MLSFVPWSPELFSAPVLERVRTRLRRDELREVPYFDGLMSGEIDALIGSFAGEPELHHPVRGRIKGETAFARFVTEHRAWNAERNIAVDDVDRILLPQGGVEEVLVHLDGEDGRFELPMALAGDRGEDGRLTELRVYYSGWPVTGGHAIRPPVLQPDPDLHLPELLASYQRALAAGDAEAAVAAFEPDGFVREPAGEPFVHRGTDELRTLYEQFFSNGGGIELEHCAVHDDGRICALEYNVVAWGRTELPPQAGIAVYVRGESGKLAAARIYDDADPPLTGPS